MIELNGVHKSFKNTEILKDVNLTVREGETVALIGSSGSGKSTLLRCINLLETPDKGRITIGDYSFDAENIKASVRREARNRTAMAFQNFGLFENKTALENVTEALIVVKKLPKDVAEKSAKQYLEKVGMQERCNYYPGALSGGQKQRVAIARSLALKPQIILLDEPTSALDPELVHEVLGVIKAASKERVTMLIVTHEMDFALDVADRVAFMDNGSILEVNSPAELFTNPQHERTRQFVERYMQRFSYTI